MKKHAFCILLVLCLVPAALFGTPLQASGEEPPVVFADFSWDSVQFHNRVAGFILEHGFGKEDNSLSHGEAAAAFLKKHPDLWREWVDGPAAEKVAAALADSGK
ncbi:hypothetical protein C8D99_10511 [Aminivibrio pyruvatiphilus]|jgi:ABC-type proline/glycine betaine transport system substrate-binding protein|uniref:Substrate binding protein of glycine betaine ABC transport system n=1 Tax=Aminivibrio pyruvatiphilus TaxID=1005740 RepID=A0A4R8M7W8_9BACT|nr:hypothetical protein [Aminivibrio pyruvatiphilus]TDY61599.1 hypothetical protein C8D99_10511 [Aminivibrio pyruvatiphilus]